MSKRAPRRTSNVKDMHGYALRVGDRIWLPYGRAGHGDQAIVLSLDPKGFFGEGTVTFKNLDGYLEGKTGDLRASSVRQRKIATRKR